MRRLPNRRGLCFDDEANVAACCAVQAIDKDVKKEVDDAVAAAKASPEIGLERMYEDIYIHPIQHVCVVTQSKSKSTRPAFLM
jgi:TPP-dependent pyruvate/acetoin dehydrogenase alpha subunit